MNRFRLYSLAFAVLACAFVSDIAHATEWSDWQQDGEVQYRYEVGEARSQWVEYYNRGTRAWHKWTVVVYAKDSNGGYSVNRITEGPARLEPGGRMIRACGKGWLNTVQRVTFVIESYEQN